MRAITNCAEAQFPRDVLSKSVHLRRRVSEFYDRYPDGHATRGRSPDDASVVLSTNDYLGLGGASAINEARIAALKSDRDSVFMSGVFLSHESAQRSYERRMASFLGAEDTVLCQSGWAANDGLIQSIADAMTPVYLDIYAHTSLWQGAHSGGAKARPFRHNDPDSLRSAIRRHGPGVVAVDSVYSTLGDICPIADFAAVAREESCILVVDESHSIGVLGAEGEGLVFALGLIDQVDFRTFSLSKALVGRGGIVAGPANILEYLRYESRPAIFSSAVLDSEVAGFTATLDLVRGARDRRARLASNAEFLRHGLRDLGFDIADTESQIIPLIGGAEDRTVELRRAFEARNVIGAVFCAPATPRNGSLLRFSISSALSQTEMDRVLSAAVEVRDELRWPDRRPPVRRIALSA